MARPRTSGTRWVVRTAEERRAAREARAAQQPPQRPQRGPFRWIVRSAEEREQFRAEREQRYAEASRARREARASGGPFQNVVARTPPVRQVALEEVRSSRVRADRVMDRSARAPARSAFNQVVGDLGRALRESERGQLSTGANASVIRRINSVATRHITQITNRLGEELDIATRQSLEESLQGLVRFAGRVNGGASLEDARMRDLIEQRRASIVAARQTALLNLRNRLSDRVFIRLVDTSLTENAQVRDMLASVTDELEQNWWQIERVIRTESSFAYNSAQVDGVRAMAQQHPGMMLRWTELIDDATGQPFDNRVAADSFAMHGQVAPVGGVFTMPPSLPRTSPIKKQRGKRSPIERLVGQSWSHPPNRPNDRAVLTPWMPDWGIPGWIYRNGRRVNLRIKT